ncbi:MAG: alpha/beta hydrolase, partial [Pseudomonadota bacterium]
MKEKILKFGYDKSLLGLLTQPGRDIGASSIGVVLLNAGIVHRIGPHRLNVKLARRLARLGIPTLRFDQSGLGDSPPSRAAVGYEQQAVNDVSSAIDTIMAETASTSVVLVGMCSGADNAYKTALADER